METRVVPIRRMRLVDEATRVIRDMILTGGLPAGSRLRQADLADQMEISRTPLREALMKLEQEGLVEVLPRGGFRVVELKLEEAVELYDIREVLDGLAAHLVAQRVTEQSLKSLQLRMRKMEKCVATKNAHEWFIHHVAFHGELFQASGNSRLIGLTSTVSLSIQRFHPLLLTTPNRLKEAFLEHQEIFKAIQAQDPQRAEHLARIHIANAKEIVLKVMEEQQRSAQALVR
ncbi:MAG: GntR family transcriptional regulator [Deltaproteobacteria bacterium]|nr:GntR family transcriptional regulator [Deltaproteobacteria bacterium]